MTIDAPGRETELDLVQFELEILTSARWLCRLTALEYARYTLLCKREQELLDRAAGRDAGPSSTGAWSRGHQTSGARRRLRDVDPSLAGGRIR